MPLSASSREVDKARLAFRSLGKDLKNEIRRDQRGELGPVWKANVQRYAAVAPSDTQRTIFKTGARVQAGLPVKLVAGAGTKLPTVPRRAFEMGSPRHGHYTRYNRRRRGQTETVIRRTSQQVPVARDGGYVVFPALARTIPTWIGSWSRFVVNRITEAANGR